MYRALAYRAGRERQDVICKPRPFDPSTPRFGAVCMCARCAQFPRRAEPPRNGQRSFHFLSSLYLSPHLAHDGNDLFIHCNYCRDSTGSPGTPPCQRCIEEKRECVLATSRRGGRRVRKKRPLDESGARAATDVSSVSMGGGPLHTPVRQPAMRDGHGIDAWPHGGPAQQQDPSWTGDGSASRTDASQSASRRSSVVLDGHLASADLLNPSDALDLLAQVADLEPGHSDKDAMPVRTANSRQPSRDLNLRYPPISDGALGFADAAALIQQ